MSNSNQMSRTQNATSNIIVSVIAQFVILVVSFVNRTVFIKLLGAEYLGVDGLFSSILTVLSIAELGIGNAIVFKLYAPISKGNEYKVRQYITLFSRLYTVIISIIAGVGAVLLPFVRYIGVCVCVCVLCQL